MDNEFRDKLNQVIIGIRSPKAWAHFCQAAGWLYQHSIVDQLLIFGQQPDAKAVAELKVWNQLGRSVKLGSKAIRLPADHGLSRRNVFELSDTVSRNPAEPEFHLWQGEPYRDEVERILAGGSRREGADLSSLLFQAAYKQLEQYWERSGETVLNTPAAGKISGLALYEQRQAFLYTGALSVTVSVARRCGLDDVEVSEDDFQYIQEFNARARLQLATAVTYSASALLRQIEQAIEERSQEHERDEKYVEPEVHTPGWVPVPGRGAERSAEQSESAALGQVRQDVGQLSGAGTAGPLRPDDVRRDAASLSDPARSTGSRENRNNDEPVVREISGSRSEQQSHGLDGAHEQSESAGRGNRSERTLQVTRQESDPAAFEQIGLFEEEYKREYSFTQAEIDHVLRLGGNTERQRERIVAVFEEQKSIAEIADTLKNLYHGGNGIGNITVWYAKDGIHLSRGKSARFDKSAQVISWESAAERIGQLLQDGQFATNVELAEAEGYERFCLAEKIWHLYHDFSDETKESGYLPSLAQNSGQNFPEESEWLTEQLKKPEFRQTFAEEYAAFWTAYQQDRDLLRFHYHKPREIWENLKDLSLPRTAFSSQLTEVPAVKQFITEDEIDAAMTRGSGFAGGKGRIFAFFQEPHTDKEKVDFLRHEYGIGGRSHALSGSMKSKESHDIKGLHYKKDGCPAVSFTWEKVSKRITDLIQKGRYLTEQEQAEYNKIQEEKELAEADAMEAQQPDPAVWDYNDVKKRHPDDMVLYQMGDFFELYGEDAKRAAPELGLHLFSRVLPGGGRVEMCGFPANQLEQYLEQLQDKHDVTISAILEGSAQRREYSVLSIDHEAEQHINAREAEFGADGTRVFRDTEPKQVKPTIREPYRQYKPKPQHQESRPYQVVVYHHLENGFDEKKEYQTLEEAEKAAQSYVDGTMEPDGFAYDGAAVYDLEARQYLRIYGDYPDEKAHEQLNELDQSHDFRAEVEAGEVQQAAEKQAVAHGTILERTSYDPAVPPYHVGDTVYLDNRPHQITELRDDTVQLLPTGMSYPVYRAESRERFDQLLWEDNRNDFYTEFLPANLDTMDQDLREVLVHGLIGEADKAELSELLGNGKSNREIALWLSRTYSNIVETMDLETGETADYRTMPEGIELEVLDADEKRLAMLSFRWNEVAPLLRGMYARQLDGLGQERPEPAAEAPTFQSETVAVYPGNKNHLPYDVVVQTLRTDEPEPPAPAIEPEKTMDEVLDEHPISIQVNGEWQTFPNARAAEEAAYGEYKENLHRSAENFHITDDHLGEGGPKAKFQANIEAIKLLKYLEETTGQATPEQQEVLSRYVGWGGLADAFDPDKESWSKEYAQLKELLTPEEYAAARGSTLNAHYTSPTVIRAIYEAVGHMGFETGKILEPSCGVGNFFGMLPEHMAGSKLYGVELDSISGRIAQQLYPKANITVAGFETTGWHDFFDLAVGNVPFGQYQVNDKAYNKLGFNIHNYFFAKAIDQVRPGGMVVFVTSRYTMDAKEPTVRRYLAQRADLLGAIRLPNNAFRANAGAEVVSDIIFLQKREQPQEVEPDWVQLGQTVDGFSINQYYVNHPEMILGKLAYKSTQYGREECTVLPIEGETLAQQLQQTIRNIHGSYQAVSEKEKPEEEQSELLDLEELTPGSFSLVGDKLYYKETPNTPPVLWSGSEADQKRIAGMVTIRHVAQKLIDCQMAGGSDGQVTALQEELSGRYDRFVEQYGTLNSRKNRSLFADDNGAYLLLSLEEQDADGNVIGKSDFFSKRTIRPQKAITHCDTPQDALAVVLNETGWVDLERMKGLTGMSEEALVESLQGVVYHDPVVNRYVTAEEYLSGNVRRKLEQAQEAASKNEAYHINVQALEAVQPEDLTADQIDVRLGAVWIDPKYIRDFLIEVFQAHRWANYLDVKFIPQTGEWHIEGKKFIQFHNRVLMEETYGTNRMNAVEILERTLNLRDVQVNDTIEQANGNKRSVLNLGETVAARVKQEQLQTAFRDWIFEQPQRRGELTQEYNRRFNSFRNRSYDGSHLTFPGMTPEITLRPHQINAIARALYGGNTLLAHVVGAGKTFEMVAIAMEAKRIGLSHKSMVVVPNHLTEQWGAKFLQLYPAAKVLVATKADFTPERRKRFCTRIATGDWDAVIIGHSQFERIPLSQDYQESFLREQIDDLDQAIRQASRASGEKWTVKALERSRKRLEVRLQKLQDSGKKDDTLPFEALGVDRLFVDEAQAYKNLFLYTKMQNVAGISTSESQRAADMYAKCRYLDGVTGGRGVVFATGTPISNSMTELYTMQRYLQYDRLKEAGLTYFDAWASTFGETVTMTELAPEGNGYRTRTRFARFHNLPELMSMFQDVADIKMADELDLAVPEAHYETILAERSPEQAQMMEELSTRAKAIHDHVVLPEMDNMLKVTTDGRKIGLDQRLIDPALPDYPESKVNLAVQNILRIWREYGDTRATQLVFCDFSTPASKRFNVYDDMKAKLIRGGVPEEEIAFIHDTNTELRKKQLFQKVCQGQVRVLFGSTEKMGAGTNVQDRLIAIHDVDCPWRPGDLEQRAGRVVRQGNQNREVFIYRYATNATFDSYLWQTVENKQKFISQVMTSKTPVRSCEDVDQSVMSYAEIKSLCAGDPLIKEKMTLDMEVSRMRLLRSAYQSQKYRLQDLISTGLPLEQSRCRTRIHNLQRDINAFQSSEPSKKGFAPFMTAQDQVLSEQKQADKWIGDQLKKLIMLEQPVVIGSWRGFRVSLFKTGLLTEQKRFLILSSSGTYHVPLRADQVHFFPGMERVLEGLPQQLELELQQEQSLEKQLEGAKAELKAPWPLEAEFRQKTARLAELEAALSLDTQTEDPKGQKESEREEDRPIRFADQLVWAKKVVDNQQNVAGLQHIEPNLAYH